MTIKADLNDLLDQCGRLLGKCRRWWHNHKLVKQAKNCIHQWNIYHDSVYSQCDGCQTVIKTMTLKRLQQENGNDWGTGVVVGNTYGVRILDVSRFAEISYPLVRAP